MQVTMPIPASPQNIYGRNIRERNFSREQLEKLLQSIRADLQEISDRIDLRRFTMLEYEFTFWSQGEAIELMMRSCHFIYPEMRTEFFPEMFQDYDARVFSLFSKLE